MPDTRMTGEPDSGEGRPPAGAPEADVPAPGRDEEIVDAEVVDEAGEMADRVEQDLDDLGAARRERDEYLELAQRTRADFDNYRKRAASQAAEAEQRGRADLAKQLIPVLDNLERAVEASGGPEAFAKGVALVATELRETLERAGVEGYDPAGEAFDPAWQEAVSTRAEPGTKPGTVVETLERGYRLDGQVLRPARVVVSE
jgi:molecular chaperone GrpE